MDVVDINMGNYQATRVLGQGGFATVYLGEHHRLHTAVAIKILKAHLSQHDQQQFLTEARVLAQLRHPNIVEVLDFGIADGSPYLVMHYLARGSLRQHYMRGKVYALEHILPHIKQIAIALQHAHDKKIIHRDVKPENVLVGDNEEAVLSDFGIAVLNAESHRQGRQDIAGTLPYMAPEQIKGFPRRSSDQYALAVMIYEWLCGSRPFTGNGIEQIARQHVEVVPPRLSEKVPTISPAVEAVVLKALSKTPEDRYSTVKQFAEALEQACNFHDASETTQEQGSSEKTNLFPTLTASTFATPQTELAVPSTPVLLELRSSFTTRRKLLIGGSIATCIALTGSAIWWTHPFSRSVTGQTTSHISTKQSPSTAMQTLTASSSHQLASGSVDSITWSPDNDQIAYGITDKKGSVRILQRSQSSTYTLPYSGPVAWAPDGRFLAACDRNQLHLWNAQTRKEEQSINLFSPQDSNPPAIPRVIAWSSNSSQLAIGLDLPYFINGLILSYNNGLYFWPSQRVITPGQGHGHAFAVTWSSDSTQIAWGDSEGDMAICKIATGAMRYYSSLYSQIFALAWSPSASELLIAGSNAPTQLIDTGTLQKKLSFTNYAAPLVWSPRGDAIASASTRTNDHNIWIWPIATGKPVFLCQGHTGPIQALAWSHDGKFLASSSKDGIMRIWSLPQWIE